VTSKQEIQLQVTSDEQAGKAVISDEQLTMSYSQGPKFENRGEFRISSFEFRLLLARHLSLVTCHCFSEVFIA
jgi:hypothetical protein